MIRRDVQIENAEHQWLLISQIEHARISAALARYAIGGFPSRHSTEATQAIFQIRSELVELIARHDDGWIAWESFPSLDPQHGRPYSFTKMLLEEALLIWSKSVERVEQIGLLAAWIVAGHFKALLSNSSDKEEPRAKEWLTEIAKRRSEWLAGWIAENPKEHSVDLAMEGLLWLKAFDELSLWLCIQAPLAEEASSNQPKSHAIGDKHESMFTVASDGEHSDMPGQLNARVVSITPHVFSESPILIQAMGSLVHRAKYQSTEQLLSACQPYTARWLIASEQS